MPSVVAAGEQQLALTPTAARDDLQRRHASRQAARAKSAVPAGARASRGPPLPQDPLSISASYFLLRRGLGLLAFAFPLLLLVGVGLQDIQPSLSAYYHFDPARPAVYGAGRMRNVFVGVLWATGMFLLLYRGYSRKEDLALDVAGLAAILVAMFPMDWPPASDVARSTIGRIHFGSAATFFVMIAYVCVFRANDTLCILASEVKRKKFRRIYAALGLWMLATPAAIFALHLLLGRPQDSLYILLIEIAGVWVFSIFWLVKSREIASIERE